MTRLARTPPTRRVERGNGHSYYLDGERADGVTYALDQGFPKPGLLKWSAEATAKYAVDHWEELAELKTSEKLDTLFGARFKDRDEAGRAGTLVHRLALELARGAEVDVPDYIAGHVDSYLKFATDWNVVDYLVEVVVLNRRWRYMGTLDLIGEIAGELWLIDFKTARSGVFAENGLQLAAYRNAESYLGDDGLEHDLPKVERCGVVWIRADGYDLTPVDAGPEEFRTFLYALEIARWRSKDGRSRSVVGEALEPPNRSEVA